MTTLDDRALRLIELANARDGHYWAVAHHCSTGTSDVYRTTIHRFRCVIDLIQVRRVTVVYRPNGCDASCECIDYKERGYCPHIDAVIAELRQRAKVQP